MHSRLAIVFLLIGLQLASRGATEFLSDDEEFIDNAIDSIPTSISPVENFILLIANPFRVFDRPRSELDENVDRILYGFPRGFREIFAGERTTSPTTSSRNGIQAIFPGTVWCGTGDVARGINDIGIFSLTDTCCRAHDSCPQSLRAGEKNRGLRNNGLFTRSHCACDEEFRRCLLATRTLISKKIGITYFDILRPQCFKLEHPIKRCSRYTSFWGTKKCLEYEVDATKNETWQWFDNNYFLMASRN